jgi:septum formation protein
MRISQEYPLILGSRSPRRAQILAELRIPFVVRPAAADESVLSRDLPGGYLERVVRNKLEAVLAANIEERAALLVADTIVVVDDRIVGKPDDPDGAFELLCALAGREHTVMTRYALTRTQKSEPLAQRTVTSRVTMRQASRDELRRYADSGEGLDKAGAYAVQGLGAFLIARIDGSYTNVVGLPACELVQDLSAVDLLGPYP